MPIERYLTTDDTPGLRRKMEDLVRLAVVSRSDPSVIRAAREAVLSAPAKDREAEAAGIYRWVREHVRYTRDPLGVDTFHHARHTIAQGAGDCDDMAILVAAMLGAVGIASRFVVISTSRSQPDRWRHIYVEALVRPGQWWPLDATEPYGPGWAPPSAVRTLVFPVPNQAAEIDAQVRGLGLGEVGELGFGIKHLIHSVGKAAGRIGRAAIRPVAAVNKAVLPKFIYNAGSKAASVAGHIQGQVFHYTLEKPVQEVARAYHQIEQLQIGGIPVGQIALAIATTVATGGAGAALAAKLGVDAARFAAIANKVKLALKIKRGVTSALAVKQMLDTPGGQALAQAAAVDVASVASAPDVSSGMVPRRIHGIPLEEVPVAIGYAVNHGQPAPLLARRLGLTPEAWDFVRGLFPSWFTAPGSSATAEEIRVALATPRGQAVAADVMAAVVATSVYPLTSSSSPATDWRSLIDPVAVVSTRGRYGGTSSYVTAADVAATAAGTWHGEPIPPGAHVIADQDKLVLADGSYVKEINGELMHVFAGGRRMGSWRAELVTQRQAEANQMRRILRQAGFQPPPPTAAQLAQHAAYQASFAAVRARQARRWSPRMVRPVLPPAPVRRRTTSPTPPRPSTSRPAGPTPATSSTPGVKTTLPTSRKRPTPAFTFQPRSYRGTPLPPRQGGGATEGTTGAPVVPPGGSEGGSVTASSIETTVETATPETSSSLMPLLLAAGALYSMS